MKTDDDSYVNVPALVKWLVHNCETEECRNEKLYLGGAAEKADVILNPGHKWENAAFHHHTKLKHYPRYMYGGGYVLSRGVANAIVTANETVGLKFFPIEDATLGFWLSSYDIRFVNHERIKGLALNCYFKTIEDGRNRDSKGLKEEILKDFCKNPWIILHKIVGDVEMHTIHQSVLDCEK